jgi:hypothetical protein
VSVVRFQVEYRRFLPGCAAGLAEKTALVELSVQGDLTGALSAEQRIRAAAPTLCPGEPLYGVAETDWPDAFLLSGPADVDDAALGGLGTWVVALTVAIQRWGRDPVLRGRLLAAGQGRLRLAVPWHRTDFFDHALAAATQLIPEWLPACPGTQRPTGRPLRRSLAAHPSRRPQAEYVALHRGRLTSGNSLRNPA